MDVVRFWSWFHSCCLWLTHSLTRVPHFIEFRRKTLWLVWCGSRCGFCAYRLTRNSAVELINRVSVIESTMCIALRSFNETALTVPFQVNARRSLARLLIQHPWNETLFDKSKMMITTFLLDNNYGNLLTSWIIWCRMTSKNMLSLHFIGSTKRTNAKCEAAEKFSKIVDWLTFNSCCYLQVSQNHRTQPTEWLNNCTLNIRRGTRSTLTCIPVVQITTNYQTPSG